MSYGCVQVLAVIVPYQGTLSGQISWFSREECGWGKGQLGGGIGRKPDQCDLTNHWPPPCPGAQVGPHRGHHNRHMPCHHYQPYYLIFVWNRMIFFVSKHKLYSHITINLNISFFFVWSRTIFFISKYDLYSHIHWHRYHPYQFLISTIDTPFNIFICKFQRNTRLGILCQTRNWST